MPALPSLEALSALALPDVDVADDYGLGWIWRATRVISATNLNDISMNSRLTYDLKSKRRLPSEDTTIALVIDTSSLSDAVNTNGLIRMLYQKS